jgi:hypothetical protein
MEKSSQKGKRATKKTVKSLSEQSERREVPGNEVTRKETPTVKEVEQPHIYKLPGDIIRQIAHTLPLKDLNALCRTSKKFTKDISNNVSFWKNLYRTNYPEIPIAHIPDENLKFEYQITYIDDTTCKINERVGEVYIIEPELDDIEKQRNALITEINKLQQQLHALHIKEVTAVNRMNVKAIEWKKKLERAKTEARKHLPKTKGNFINIEVSKNLFEILTMYFRNKKDRSINTFLPILRKGGVKGKVYGADLKDAIGISVGKPQNPPEMLLYVTEIQKRFRGTVKPSTIVSMVNCKEPPFRFPYAMYQKEGSHDYITWKYDIKMPKITASLSDMEEEMEQGKPRRARALIPRIPAYVYNVYDEAEDFDDFDEVAMANQDIFAQVEDEDSDE